ncbi:hypothetical protein MA6G0125S_2148 [Mycobacteroides abscessus 6G-0125-S]|nr:hypothetical protein MA6G0125S_2148 [Mycobacteroides abscessus 6G-0125-S]EIU54865.1 hypothetical protein MA6G0728S_5102 [Mycobacteroides abscessus 6G-0728-S]
MRESATASAVFLRYRHAEQAKLACSVPQFSVDVVLVCKAVRMRRQFGREELRSEVTKLE